ncbi:MAG TPA: TonB-dependent receptor [Allosphingosinicella sp.]|nr:TonB-dependent receptor [Allosphingosinicella sp.]
MTARQALLAALIAGVPAPLLAQAPPPAGPPVPAPKAQRQPPPVDPDEALDEEDNQTIIVTGQRPRGSVIGDIPPEIQLGRRDIRALGAGSIAELLDAIGPQTRSGRGRGEGMPIILLNGRRISGFAEIRDIPPEAIVRIDIMPEEVALKYGYRADQRVVNFVLRPRFRAYTGELEGGLATDGGRATYGIETSFLRISKNGRVNLSSEYQHSGSLLESERGIVQANPAPGIELGRYRTLIPETDQLNLGATVNRQLGDVSATLNGRLDLTGNEALLGLPRPSLAPPALRRISEGRNGHLGLALNGVVAPWQWSVTGNYDRTRNETRTDTDIGRDRSESTSQVGSLDAVANGPLLKLPGGPISTTVRAGFDARSLDSESTRGGIVTLRDLSRTHESAQVNVDVPIASRRRAVLKAVGNLSANFNAEVENFSDFGMLRTLGAGLNWSPLAPLSLIASVTDEDGAPAMQQLGDPVIATPGVRLFDFVRGETVEVTRVEGGNPALRADNRRVWKLGATLRPLSKQDLTLSANYTESHIVDQISSFPAATAEIEAAFPERFERDANGRLVRIDARPVNFARANRSELRWGVNFSMPVGPQPQPGQFRGRFGQGGRPGGPRGDAPGQTSGTSPQGQPQAQPQPAPEGGRQGRGEGSGSPRGAGGPGGGFRGGFGGGGRGFGGPGGGRLQLALYHTWRFTDRVLIRPGVPELDFLAGSAAGSRGGRPRHELEFQSGLFKDGLGARLTANWQSATLVRGGTTTGAGTTSSDLFFSSFASVNLRLFADLGQQPAARKHPFLRGLRVSLAIDNLLDSRQQVRDGFGAVPLSYQPGYVDPLGRSVRLSIRKLFF